MSDEIHLRAVDLYNDPLEDECTPHFENKRTVAILEINGIKIPLSLTRLKNLIESVKLFDSTIFCYQCEHFIMSHSGWEYGGSCKLSAMRDGKTLNESCAGYSYCVDCMHTCEDALKKF